MSKLSWPWKTNLVRVNCDFLSVCIQLSLIFVILITGFEIPDMDAERLFKISELVRYIADREDVYE